MILGKTNTRSVNVVASLVYSVIGITVSGCAPFHTSPVSCDTCNAFDEISGKQIKVIRFGDWYSLQQWGGRHLYFREYFTVRDKQDIAKLYGLVRVVEQDPSDTPSRRLIPLCGYLTWLEFEDGSGRKLAAVGVSRAGEMVRIDGYLPHGGERCLVAPARPLALAAFEMMRTHAPSVLREFKREAETSKLALALLKCFPYDQVPDN